MIKEINIILDNESRYKNITSIEGAFEYSGNNIPFNFSVDYDDIHEKEKILKVLPLVDELIMDDDFSIINGIFNLMIMSELDLRLSDLLSKHKIKKSQYYLW